MKNKIFTYNFSIQGKGHKKNNIPCQDYSATEFIGDKLVIGAIADGIGSAKHSDIAAKMAVTEVIRFVKENLPHNIYDKNLMYALMMLAFSSALKKIQIYSKENNISMDELDTTLDVAVYDGKTIIIYGHVGDSGIMALNEWGEYVHITKQHKGEEHNQTSPLAHVGSWVFGDYRNETLNSVIMATDGMLEKALCFPNINKVQPYDYYIPALTFFADPDIFMQNPEFSTEEGKEAIISHIEEFITARNDYNSDKFYNTYFYAIQKKFPEKSEEDIYDILRTFVKYNMPVTLTRQVTDDKTILAMVNIENEHSEPLPENSYHDIDWLKLNNIEFPDKNFKEEEKEEKTESEEKKYEYSEPDVSSQETDTRGKKTDTGMVSKIKETISGTKVSETKKKDIPADNAVKNTSDTEMVSKVSDTVKDIVDIADIVVITRKQINIDIPIYSTDINDSKDK
ncbi:MAG: protein phosphatase 2C domain-containing protein [Ruminococcus sp.]|nr:protein phosphatase 2C domain-containing protein [Ruminococcus sp.]